MRRVEAVTWHSTWSSRPLTRLAWRLLPWVAAWLIARRMAGPGTEPARQQ
jgi:hypothetical protein